MVQTTATGSHSWVITGFNALPINSYVLIVGYIDMPAGYGYLGYGEIITYNNTDPTNIRANGFIIDFWSNGNFGINVLQAAGFNVDS
jgi:hypothetical protein